MSHSGHQHHAGRNLAIAFGVNLLFVLVEVAGGLWTNSMAILTDALHDAGDCLSLGIAWYLQRVAEKDPSHRFTYGYRRFSSLGALVTGVVLMVGLAVVAWNAMARLSSPESVHAPGMLGIAVVGIVLNGGAAWILGGGRSLNEKVASWHLLEDTLGWVAVLIGSSVMMVKDLPVIDPLLALIISLFILWNVIRNLGQVAMVFLQSSPRGFDAEQFDRQLAEIAGVVDSHHTHTWTLDGERHVFSTHLVMDASSTREQIVAAKRRVHQLLGSQDFEHITVEVELVGEQCGANTGHEHSPSSRADAIE